MTNDLISLLLAASLISLACGQRPTTPQAKDAKGRAEQATASKTAEANEPCALITRDDAAEVLGGEVKVYVGPPVTTGGMRSQRCRYYTPDSMLDVEVTSPVSSSEFKKSRVELESDQANKVQSISNIGDQAFIAATGGTTALNMLKGNTAVGIGLLDKARVSPDASSGESFKAFSEGLKTLGAKAASRVR